MGKFGATFRVNPALNKVIDGVERNLVLKVLPKALAKAVVPIKAAITVRLPDGQTSSGGQPATRSKQSAKVKARFPYHLKDRVRSRTLSDEAGVLKIVGIDEKGAHVNFDFGKKAMTTGRDHIYWGNRPSPQVLRRQTQDIPAQVEAETKTEVLNIITRTIQDAANKGEL